MSGSLVYLMFLAWPLSIALLWLVLMLAIPDPEYGGRHSTKAIRLLLGLPPTLLLMAFFIPPIFYRMARFNVASDLVTALSWASGLACLSYAVAIAKVAARAETRYLVVPTVLACLSCGTTWFFFLLVATVPPT